jgi:hypothetical protein
MGDLYRTRAATTAGIHPVVRCAGRLLGSAPVAELLRDAGIEYARRTPAALAAVIACVLLFAWAAYRLHGAGYTALAVVCGLLVLGAVVQVPVATGQAADYCRSHIVSGGDATRNEGAFAGGLTPAVYSPDTDRKCLRTWPYGPGE